MRWCLYTVYQLSILLSIYENEILTSFVELFFSILSVNCSHVCMIYVKIYEKISSGGLEVSLSIDTEHFVSSTIYLCFINTHLLGWRKWQRPVSCIHYLRLATH